VQLATFAAKGTTTAISNKIKAVKHEKEVDTLFMMKL